MPEGIQLRAPRSLGFKVMAALMLGLGISFTLLIINLSSSKLHSLTELADASSRDQTLLAAGQARPGVERRDESYLENIYVDLIFGQKDEDYASPEIQMLRVLDRDGERLKTFETLNGPHISPSRLDEMARAAMESGAVQDAHEGDLAVFAAPIFSEGRREAIGSISIAWNHGHLHAAVMRSTIETGLYGLGAAVLVMLAIGYLMHRLVLGPIEALAQAVRRIENSGDLVSMPQSILNRSDEIGSLATRFQSLLALSNAQIISRRRQLDTALESMAQGLCLFDGDNRLVVSNRRLEEIYQQPAGAFQPGQHIREVLAACCAKGNYSAEAIGEIEKSMLEPLPAGKPRHSIDTLLDGRVISVFRVAMPEGGWVATFEDITERKRTEERIQHMALHDPLTGLPNRRRFREQLHEALGQAARNQMTAVLCLDLDNFKPVNDTLGHPIGDGLLQEVAERLQTCLRNTGLVARLGGDEFAIVERNLTSVQDVDRLAKRIVEVLGEPFEVAGHHIVIGTSVGIALAPDDGADADTLLKGADLALYRAKTDGRNTYRFFEKDMDARMQERRALELDLRKALTAGDLELHYQPIVNLETGEVSCFEALLRWPHETRGMVSPAEFVPLAEEIGLIGQIGRWVLREACERASDWPEEVRVAVNLSPVQFRSMALVDDVEAALGASGLTPGRLELEITETVLLQNSEQTLSILKRLREIGVRISMDDFGTGYSSLSYLRNYPFDKIKIDRSFIRDLATENNSLAIVRAIASMSSGLGMSTTAEGVETLEQLEQLRVEGCTEVQGFYYSPAVKHQDALGLIKRIAQGSAKPRLVRS
ncbi:putative bifunctional diguanylate cyclase/phosphodiesterase [Limimaricola soesokkakensis]|uniref:putative bifunctional diguanylate cyclase/phosphodiesterase n=1 Tax=Limimaricola soesokkakensis TaxID=1343159 RepID=UPI00351551EE